MKILIQLALVFCISLAGDFISSLLPFAFPGGIIALFIMLFLLLTGIVKERHIFEVNEFIMSNLAFFFIPANVQIIKYLDLLKNTWFLIILLCVVSVVLSFGAISWSVTLVCKILEKREKRK